MIVWISRALALAIHDRQLAEHGGATGIRDEGLLESALARPRQLHTYGQPTPDLADLAAATAFGLARNHPFVDGNKRVALATCLVFLSENGLLKEETLDVDNWENLTLAVAAGALSRDEVTARLRKLVA